jgi:hypothetical protein
VVDFILEEGGLLETHLEVGVEVERRRLVGVRKWMEGKRREEEERKKVMEEEERRRVERVEEEARIEEERIRVEKEAEAADTTRKGSLDQSNGEQGDVAPPDSK